MFKVPCSVGNAQWDGQLVQSSCYTNLLCGANAFAVGGHKVGNHVKVWNLCWGHYREVNVELVDVGDSLWGGVREGEGRVDM